MRRVFISGKVNGLSYVVAQERFNEAARLFSEYDVVNPTKLCNPRWSWWRCMAVCLWHLVRCDTVAMLSNWRGSRGAKIEHFLALLLFKKVLYLH